MKLDRRSWWVISAAVALGLGVVGARWPVEAQERPGRQPARARVEAAQAPATSVQDALLRPMDLPFGEETTLEQVRSALSRALNAQVVLDRSALDRLELTPEDTVRLDLKGVRLKVGLKLLLDQVGMTFRVVPEDNLLILTDPASGDDPAERTMAELKAIHRELHDLQDAVDDLRDLVEEDLGVEPEPRKDRNMIVRRPQGRGASVVRRIGARR